MVPGKYNIVCPQGSTLEQRFTYKIDDVPVNLAGYSARMQVRERHTSKTFVVNLSTENAAEMLVDSSGNIDIYISSQETSEIAAKEYVYDLELISPSLDVFRLIEGKFIVTPEVTR